MAVTTWGAKQAIDPPMMSGVEIDTKKDTKVTEGSKEHENATKKDKVVTDKVVPMPRTPPSFP